MTKAQENQALTTYWIKKYTELYGTAPVVNRNKAQFGWKDMRLDMSLEEIYALIDFFFSVSDRNDHDLHKFFWNYDEVIQKRGIIEADRAARKRMAETAQKKTKEFEERIARITSNQRGSQNQ